MDTRDCRSKYDDNLYEAADYYSDKIVALNNARADKLMRQLRRFAAEHREVKIDFNNPSQDKWSICYDHSYNELTVAPWTFVQHFGFIYFDFEAVARLAIDTFHDELVWYFTEYRDSL
jgi:hypothetical protein